jgi:hypothetical protein
MKTKDYNIKEKLTKKSVVEINAIAKRLNFPLRGNKKERINSLYDFFKAPERWNVIINE